MWRWGLFSLTVPVGVLLMAVGERDDSPGLGGIGLIVVLASIGLMWRFLARRK